MRLPRVKDYPKELNINDETYKIRWVKCIQRDASTLGLCDSGSQIIYIKKGLNPTERLATFIHEALHAMEFEHEIKIHHFVVYQLERALLQFLLNNY